MKKKIILIICTFLFITNVKALTFNVNLTNIEDKGSNGTIGSITNIDVPNKSLDVLFQDIGDEVNFALTITNSGNRAGTLRSISVTSSNDKIEYTNNLPESGLAINGNDTNEVIITGKVLSGAVNGKSTSEIKITYNFDEGSCPDGEILSSDESMCLCPEGTERNEKGVCVSPPEDKKIECKDNEIYNETKKICEEKLIPKNPSNPKTLDNIILITLLFIVSGLGIYAVMYKKLKTDKKKITVGVITGVITLGAAFSVLVSVFGLDNLLSAIVNPITKSKELVVTVNEEIDLIETWDGDCDITEVSKLTPNNIFQDGSGTEEDPYQIKTANQLACFAKSINNGETYEGKFIKQTKNIKLNDNLNAQATAGDLSNANLWITAGVSFISGNNVNNLDYPYFSGTYNGDNHTISGLYITDDSAAFGPITDSRNYNIYSYLGMFGQTKNATFKNVTLTDVYANNNNRGNMAALVGFAYESLTLDNVKTYGTLKSEGQDVSGIVSNINGNNVGILTVKDTINYINVTGTYGISGIIHRVYGFSNSEDYNIIFQNCGNEGILTFNADASGGAGLFGYSSSSANTLIEKSYNKGDLYARGNRHSLNVNGGLVGSISGKLTMKDSYNEGDFYVDRMNECGGVIGSSTGSETTIDNCYNSGNIVFEGVEDFIDGVNPSLIRTSEYPSFGSQSIGGIAGNVSGKLTITNSYNTGNIKAPGAYVAGLIGVSSPYKAENTMTNCYNTGNIAGRSYVGGLVGTGPNIDKSYNTGTVTLFGDVRAGGLVGYEARSVSNSYNLGDIYVNSKTGSGGMVGGLCSACNNLSNSYNRGNIHIKYDATLIGGLNGLSTTVTNSYNSGNIIFEDLDAANRSNITIGGLGAQGSATNSYNIGNIDVTINKRTTSSQAIAGINTQGNSTNSVNVGNMTITFGDPEYVYGLTIYGICMGTSKNSFQAGTISLGEYLAAYDASKQIYIGEISGNVGGNEGNKWNTNPDGVALACIGRWSGCTLEASEASGEYTTESAPDIMSIINGDEAFEILAGDTLPTLKVFNE